MQRLGPTRFVCLLALGSGVWPGADLSFENHKQLYWSGPCVAAGSDTPCRTVRYRQSGYGKEGFFDQELTDAVDRRASSSSRVLSTWRSWWLRVSRSDFTTVQLPPQERTYVIDHKQRKFESRQRAMQGSAIWEQDDAACSHAASHFLYLDRRLAGDDKVAGYATVAYAGRDSTGGEYIIRFAPSLGCQQMAYRRIERGFLGIVTSLNDMVVTSFTLVEPAPELFAVPSGYTQVRSLQELEH